jgi:hypothetical protein
MDEKTYNDGLEQAAELLESKIQYVMGGEVPNVVFWMNQILSDLAKEVRELKTNVHMTE